MNEVLVDTDILSYYLNGDKKIIAKFAEYLSNYEFLNLSIITYYEIVSGLIFKNATVKLKRFEEFIQDCKIYPVTKKSAKISSEIYSELRKSGKPLDDIDLLIAGIAIENDLILATNNEKHFGKIKQIKIENWIKI